MDREIEPEDNKINFLAQKKSSDKQILQEKKQANITAISDKTDRVKQERENF